VVAEPAANLRPPDRLRLRRFTAHTARQLTEAIEEMPLQRIEAHVVAIASGLTLAT